MNSSEQAFLAHDNVHNGMQLISVVLPAYNRERTVERAVRSVLEQSYQHIEVIVVDDCSTDKTMDVLKGIEDDRLRVLHLENHMGACYARNYGVAAASGDLIAFQDSDDFWRKDFLKIMITEFLYCNRDVVFCRIARHEMDGSVKEFPGLPSGDVLYKTLIRKSQVSTQSLLGKSECFRMIPFDVDMPRLQDYDLVIRLAENYSIYHVDKVLVDVYVQDDSLSNDIEKMIKAIEMLLVKYDVLLGRYPETKAGLIDSLAGSYLRRGQVKKRLFLEAYKTKHSLKRLIKIAFFFSCPEAFSGLIIYLKRRNRK